MPIVSKDGFGLKLHIDDIKDIRDIDGSLTYREIAEFYGISQTMVGHIFHKRRWF